MITVRGTHADGEVVAFPLPHGADPEDELRARGWLPGEATAAGRAPSVTLTYAVTPGAVVPSPVVRPGTGPRHQRLAAYAVVVANHRVLLTELSENVLGGAGLWVLPGGGIDPGEEPEEAIVREVWEETGQQVDTVRLLRVLTTHRPDARGADGGPVDFQAVRLVHRARCPRPTEAVVHDVGGSTARAAWVPVDEVTAFDLVPWVLELLVEQPRLLHP